ncbi:PQQ-binding-like beta-propeller repeat protein [Galbibacter sp. BG1]|uniref:outer membrane protein assembly factor BamB family protein n=1 Tax=Galbibacter sp. BG1 TaxID=1170699 RepID=UPI0015BF271B|nr:PQQ-binding-like beta-propeller repeat protein [Galbibacter sp. BG1]QLE02454.1 PQQ-binding-like beta-propeller repeat protein [Galbibacter sp. BG1]
MRKIVYFILITLVGSLHAQSIENPSGNKELDSIRQAVKELPTGRENFKPRAIRMKLWAVTLQQQGVRLDDYVNIDNRLNKVTRWNNLWSGNEPQEFSDEEMGVLGEIVDDGYSVLEKYQAVASSGRSMEFASNVEPIDPDTQEEIPWTSYKGNEGLTGYTGANGPTKGVKAWTFPVGLAWESKPAIQGDRVYLSSPGVRTTMYCLDLNTGNEIWSTSQTIEIMGDQLYHAPNNQSSPVVLKDHILFRELGARGNKGPTKDVVFVNKKTGEIERELEVGHVDYRAGHAAFDANEEVVVFPFGVQDIHTTPPLTQAHDRVIGKNLKTGEKLFEFYTGYTFAEPLLDNSSSVYQGTMEGYMYSWKANKRLPNRPKPDWEFRAGGAINDKAVIYGDYVMFGANDGVFYCLNKNNGKLQWKYATDNLEKKSFRYFSAPFAKDGKVAVGAANKKFYVFDVTSGKLILESLADDWIRAAPVFNEDGYFFATMKGTLYGVQKGRKGAKTIFKKTISHHPIIADLAIKDQKLVMNDSDLYAHCIDTKGRTIWKKSLIESFEKDGNRILSDQIAGGAYYQSKPIAADGMVFFGSPIRFVYAVDAQTGKEIWKHEIGASISGAPTYYDGKIYVGQQGGEDDFYCLDAKTGELVWKQNVDWVWGSATCSDGMVYIPGIDGYAWALDAETGQMIWKKPFSRSVCSEPAVEGNTVVFGSWDDYLKAFNKKTGELLWQYNGAGTDSGVAIVDKGKVYVKNKCIDLETGKLLWEFIDGKNIFNITPAVHNGKVYMSCWHGLGMGGITVEAVLYCIDAETGELIWTQLGAGLSSPVIGGEGNVYFPSIADPYFYSVDSEGNGDGTTTVNFMYQMGNKVEESTPALYKGKAYIMSSDGYIHAIK